MSGPGYGRVSVVERWDVEPLQRSRRGLDERLLMAAPWLLRLQWALLVGLRPGSQLRRALIGHVVRVGVAANNRGDYEALVAFMSSEIELHVYPDAPELRPLDAADPIYHGREGYVNASKVLKAGLGNFRWEVRELVDPGGDRFGARTERVGRGSRSGVEVRDTEFEVWQVRHGLLRHQWTLSTEAAMLELLERKRVAPR